MKFYYIFLILLFTSFKAQKISLAGNSMKPFPYNAETISKSDHNIYYTLKFARDAKNPKKILETICVLRLGENFSMFSDFNGVRSDSLTKQYSHKSEINAKEFAVYNDFVSKWYIFLIKNFKENKIIIQDQAKGAYQYEEKQPELNWKLEKETKDILGYLCQKATTEYRGRKYTAWYAKDIPINNGPYIFQGLPGLIMEIEDNKEHYHFIAVAMDKKPNEIYLKTESHILKVSREQFRKTQKNVYENPSFYSEPVYDANGNTINITRKSRPYNPIELE